MEQIRSGSCYMSRCRNKRCVNLSLIFCLNTQKRKNNFLKEMEKFIRTEDEQEKEEISDQQDKDFVS